MSKYTEMLQEKYEDPNQREQKLVAVEDAAQRLLQKALQRETRRHDSDLASSIAKRAVDGPQGPRTRMPEPPRQLRWGGTFSTERDEQYCRCGRLKTAHPVDPAECSKLYEEAK